MPLVVIEQAQRLREPLLVSLRELDERVEKLRLEDERAIADRSALPLLRSPADTIEKLGLSELEYAASFDVHQGALERRERLGGVRPAILLWDQDRWPQLDDVVRHLHLELATVAEPERATDVGGQGDAPLLVHRHHCSRHRLDARRCRDVLSM